MFKNKNNSDLKKKTTLETRLLPFLSSHYQKINVARLQHLESLGLSISGRKVIDLGAGIGDHTLFYLFKNCVVLPVEGRQELTNFISERFGIKSVTLNFESESSGLASLGSFDIVHCYGLLYHLSNPAEFLSFVPKLANILFLETCVSPDNSLDSLTLINEDKTNSTQAISGTGCWPTRKWVYNELKKYYRYVYFPLTQPRNDQFPTNWVDQKGDDQNKRAIFIASEIAIQNHNLTEEFITSYKSW